MMLFRYIAMLLSLATVSLFLVPMICLAQTEVKVGTIADELAEVAAFVRARSVFESDREVLVPEGGSLEITERIFSADKIVLESGASIKLGVPAKLRDPQSVYVVVRELILPDAGDVATIGWSGSVKRAVPAVDSRAPDGVAGKGAGQRGQPGKDGRDGLSGQSGNHAPALTIVVQSIVGELLKIDLAGGIGGDGGQGQAGGHGGNGAQGASARTAWVKLLGLKTGMGCAAGPGTGGTGGTGGNGGQGGKGGDAGNGGYLRLVSTSETSTSFFKSTSVDVSPGMNGNGGYGGDAGSGGAGGREGQLSTHCGSAGRRGSNGSPGRPGVTGPRGEDGVEGRLERVDLAIEQINRAFGFEEN